MRASTAAARDSVRKARLASQRPNHGWGGLMADSREAPLPAPKVPRAPDRPHTLWTDRPLTTLGTHTARAGSGEYQIGAWSYARSERSWSTAYWVTGPSGDTLVTDRTRLRATITELFQERLVVGLAHNADLTVIGTLYEHDRVEDLEHGWSQTRSGRPDVYTGLLRVRVAGGDSTAWSRAVGLSYTHAQDLNVFGIVLSQVFPIVSRLSGRAHLEMEAASGSSAVVGLAGLSVVHHWMPDLWVFGEYTGAYEFQGGDRAGSLGTGLAVAAGVHFMFDGGVRFGLNENIADSQLFAGVSFR
jgi:hypothetical protein